jgi:hypothetical protein
MDVGQSATFNATASGGSGNYTSYHWYVNGTAQSGATASTFSYSPASTGTYLITATVTDSTSATSAQSSAADVTASVTVTPTSPSTTVPKEVIYGISIAAATVAIVVVSLVLIIKARKAGNRMKKTIEAW